MPDPPPRVYARSLLPFGYGHPLWTPEPGHQFQHYRRDGLRIGDVGVIVPENGSFDVFFNICLPRDHPFHRVNGVPDNFEHVDLDELDVAIYPHAENPGSVVSTSAVTALRTIGPSDGADRQNALTYEFSLSSSEGALLILPDGAESYSLLKRMLFRDVATRNGVDWYNFAEQRLGRIITHDSLYLITGCYKSYSWSVAAFHGVSSQTGATEFPAQFKAGHARQGNISASYTWETTRALHWRVGPLDSDRTGMPNQAVFISGFKIAIRDNILGRKRVEVEVDTSPTHLKPAKLYNSGKGHSRAGKIWRRLVSRSGGERTGEQAEAGSTNHPGAGIGATDGSMDIGRCVTVRHIPEALQSFHPSDIVNRYLLSKEPSATVAVTHDSQWSILLEKGILKPEDLYHDDQLESIVSKNYRIVSQDGVVCLKAVNDSSIQLTEIDGAVREAWKKDKLDDAEELLSRRIIRCTGSDHFALSNRALIRARLHHWGAALRDAETSIAIQPSVTAHVAKGFALFGQQQYASAVHVFNVALRECDVRDKVIVLLIKSIVLFEVGYRAESMAEIADLIEHCPAEARSACSASQGEMCVRLATTATKNEDYDRALQLLSHAQSLGPFHVAPELEIVSLICGWRFDNLQFSAYQRKCEALYVAGCINEAVDSLNELTRDLSEDMRTRKDNAEWIATFTRQCLQSLEGLGDGALTSQNYAEAIAHYSVALSMGPTTREGILVKRSTAHAAVGAWNDALNDADEMIALNPLSPWGHEGKLAALQGMGHYDEAIQAFNDMLSTLERFAYLHTRQFRSGHTGETMAIQRIDPRLPTLHNYPPHRNLDHKLIIESIMTDVDSRRTTDILDMLRAERDKMVRERKALPSVSQMDPLEQPLIAASVSEASKTSFAAHSQQLPEQLTAFERYQKLHDQLTDLVQQNKDDEKQAPELIKMVLRLAEQQLRLKPQQDEQDIVPVFELLDELHIYNAKQRELLDALSGYWNKDSSKGKQQEKDGGTEREPLPYGFRTLREDFINALTTEARTIVEEIARLGEERRWLQQDLGQLMLMKAKYGPGGEFEPEWRPPPPPPPTQQKMSRAYSQKEPTRPSVPPLPLQAKSTGSANTQNSRPGWRSVEPVVKQRSPSVGPIHPEGGVVGLLGPSTPRKTSLLDVEAISERNLITAQAASKTRMIARPASPSETLALNHPERDELISTNPRLFPLSKPSLGRSSPKFDASSAPSPLSLTLPPLDDSKSDILKELAQHVTDTSRGTDTKFEGAIDM